MNKKRVDEWIPKAKEALQKFGIATKDGKINSTYRGQISAFGAAIIMGSFKSAIAFYSNKGSSDTERPALIRAMYYIVTDEIKDISEIYDSIIKTADVKQLQEKFVDASIALKLAMNFFDMGKKEAEKKKKEESREES